MNPSDALAVAERQFESAPGVVQFDPHVQDVLGREYVVHGQQQYRGLSIYPHSVVVTVASDASVKVDGHPLIELREMSVVPRLSVVRAVSAAFRHIRNGGTERCHTPHPPRFANRRYRPSIVSAFPMPNRPTVLSRGPFGEPVQANLVIHRDTRRLAWLVWMYVEHIADYTTVIAANGEHAGEVLYCAVEAASAICSAHVYLFNPDEGQPVEILFPRPIADYPAGIRPGTNFREWVESDRALGNNVKTLFGNQNPKARLTAGGPAGKRFVTAVGSDDEKAVNAFFLCNFAHDFFSLIGFDEKDGNFQAENFSGEGQGGDRLLVNVVQAARGEANVRAQNDGTRVELTLGKWSDSGKHTALDADIVLHEFAHGVSQRLVGGKQKKDALKEPQSLALGEAWSDYFAITIQNFYRTTPRFTFGAYVSQHASGVRPDPAAPVPYDQFNGHFGMLGTPPFDEQHAAGAVFAAALIRMQEELRALLGAVAGHEAGWRLVIASLKKLAANPNFLDARNKILECVPTLALPGTAAIEAAIRSAFARHGLGANARCNGTSLSGAQPDFNP